MPGKKKKKGKKGGGQRKSENTIEEVTLDQLQSVFKNQCRTLNISSNASETIMDIFKSYVEDEEKGTLSQLCIGNETSSLVVEALFNSIKKSNYSQLRCIYFWRSTIGDIGAAAAGDIIANIPTIQTLEIRDSNLSEIGCHSLAKSLLINNRKFKSLVTLRLDFNKIGSNGLLNISNGLQNNRCIKRLSFAFCNIYGDKNAHNALRNIFTSCFLLEQLNLENNMLGTTGCIGLITGIKSIKSITFNELNISSNQVGQDLLEGHVQILHALAQQFKACNTLQKISFHGNFFDEKIADVFLMMLSNEQANHIKQFTVPHTLPVMVVDAFYKTLQSHNAKTDKKIKTNCKKSKKKASKKKK